MKHIIANVVVALEKKTDHVITLIQLYQFQFYFFREMNILINKPATKQC